ncbi:MAG: permease [Chitinophaga sp.]|jgi:uncharacterized protein|nr:permease [Chitinophaga sp.]
MSLTMLLLLIVIGLASGMLSGMVGVGGGLIIVPALIFFLAFSQKEAQGTSLGILLLPVGILGVLQYYKQGYVDIKVVLLVSLGFVLGNYFGSKLALSLPEEKLKKIFAIFLIVIAVKILFIDKYSKENKRQTTDKEQTNNTH